MAQSFVRSVFPNCLEVIVTFLSFFGTFMFNVFKVTYTSHIVAKIILRPRRLAIALKQQLLYTICFLFSAQIRLVDRVIYVYEILGVTVPGGG